MFCLVVGLIIFDGWWIDGILVYWLIGFGICYVSEGWYVFLWMIVEENLEMGVFCFWWFDQEVMDQVLELFLWLKEWICQQVGIFFGGEQQMLVIGWVLMGKLWLLLFDELLMGLVLLIVWQIFGIVCEINVFGVIVLLVEQNVVQVLVLANCGYVLEIGEIVFFGIGQELLVDDWVWVVYLGEEVVSQDMGWWLSVVFVSLVMDVIVVV